MNYLDIVNLVMSILFTASGVMMIHFVIFGIVGVFKYKKFPETKKINKYGIIIPARNEELVVGNLIESIQLSDYPQDQLTIFVIAHNCTDKTAEIARSYKNVVVYEYNNPEECTMGFAFRYLFAQIEKDYGTANFDGFFLFNADNIVSKNYFNKMNDAFEFYGHKSIVTSYRNSKNFSSNSISGLSSVYFAIGCVIESRARTVMNCSTRVQGTGYVIPAETVKNGWRYVTLTEDWEFSVDQILAGNKIYYCDEAVYFDEQPTSFKIMWRQRVRWSRGHLLVCVDRIKDLFKALFSRKTKHRMSVYDITTNILPFCLILTFLSVVQFLLMFFSPLSGISLQEAFLGQVSPDLPWIMNLITPKGFLFSCVRGAILWYLGTFMLGVMSFVICRKKIKNVSFFQKAWYCLIAPIYFFFQFFIDVQALFSRNLVWKTIPHDDANNIKTLS